MAAYSLVKILKPGIGGRICSIENSSFENPYDCELVWFPGDTLMLEIRVEPRMPKWSKLMFEGKTYLVPRSSFCKVEDDDKLELS